MSLAADLQLSKSGLLHYIREHAKSSSVLFECFCCQLYLL